MSKKQRSEKSSPKPSGKSAQKTFGAGQMPWYLVLMPLIVVVYSFGYFYKGEILALNYGGGWDGSSYVYLAVAPPEKFTTDAYRSQRILPTLIVRASAEFVQRLQIDPNLLIGDLFYRWFYGSKGEFEKKPNPTLAMEAIAVYFFVWYSLVILVLSALLWAGISFFAKLSFTARWLGFIGLLGNFAVMKMVFFYPTLTDLTALFLGLLALFGYLAKQQWIVLLAAFGGLLTWPTAFPLAALLFLFPQASLPALGTSAGQKNASPEISDSILNPSPERVIAFAAAILTGLLTTYFLFFQNVRFPGVEEARGWAVLPNILLQMAYVAFSVGILVRIASDTRLFMRFRAYLQQSSVYLPLVIRACLLVATWGLGWFLRQGFINNAAPAPLNTEIFLAGSFSVSVAKPLLSIVAASVYLGPIILLMIPLYSSVLRRLSAEYHGLLLAVAATVLLGSIMTESRQLVNLFPCLVFAVALAFDSIKKFSSRETLLILGLTGALSIVSSKIWLPLNFPGLQDFVMKGGFYAEFPMQRYFMNYGPWMTWESYAWQAPCVAVAVIILVVVVRKIKQSA